MLRLVHTGQDAANDKGPNTVSAKQAAAFEGQRSQGAKVAVSETMRVSDRKVLASLRQDAVVHDGQRSLEWRGGATAVSRESLLDSFRAAEELVRNLLLSALRDVEIFSPLGEERLAKLADAFSEAVYNRGELIFEQGDVGDQFFVVLNGRCAVVRAEPVKPAELTDEPTEPTGGGAARRVAMMERQLAVLTDGMYFGERAMLKNQTRYASVKCESKLVRAAFIARRDLEATLGARLEDLIPDRYRLDKSELLGQLRSGVRIFDPLRMSQLSALVDRMVEEHYVRGDYIVREGEAGQAMYVILKGRVDVLKRGERISSLGVWGVFGERALLRHERRFAAVQAASVELSVLKITSDGFEEALGASVEELLVEQSYS